ncbi:MAG: DUF4358 domain-containing protein [Clostridia bacterium]|nr:DUF4358 domain-containing protein [Clostridia bacterium]
MKPVKLFSLALSAVLLLCSCSRKEYTDSVSCRELGDDMLSALSDGQEYTEYDSTHRQFYFEDTEDYDDCCIIYSLDTNDINEIGIFHARNAESAGEVAEDCREYVNDMKEDSRAFIASYAPAELPKLDNAEVRVWGNYVIYTILPTPIPDTVLRAIETKLTK